MLEEILFDVSWQTVVLNNTLEGFVRALIYFVGLVVVFRLLQSIFLLRLKILTEKTHTDIDNTFISILQSVRPSFYFVSALYISLRTLNLSPVALKIADATLIIVIVAQTLLAIQVLINYIVRRRTVAGDERSVQSAVRFLSLLSKISLWTLGILFILSNIGINVNSLVAGLGVGGIAIALAAQNILGDFFSSLAIYFDKPFKVGDFITIDDVRGTVSHIGIKTTRIQSLEGEEVVISNREVIADRVQNFSRMQERRVAFDIVVASTTSSAKLKALPQLFHGIVTSVPGTRFERAHLRKIEKVGFQYRVVYYMKMGGFDEYMHARQEVNFKIIDAFSREGIALG